jgi:hypothetical protein
MSAFNRLLSLVADIFTINFSEFSVSPRSMNSSERQELRPIIMSVANRITGINRGIEGIIREIGNNPLSADDINILYTIEELYKQLMDLIYSQNNVNYESGLDNNQPTRDDTRRILTIWYMLDIFITSCKRRSNIYGPPPPDIEAAATQRATIAIADRRTAMADLHRDLESSARAMESQAAYIRRQEAADRDSLRSSRASANDDPPLSDARSRLLGDARAPANAAPGLASVARYPEYAPMSPDYPPPRSPDYPPPFQLYPLADPFAAAAAPQSIERVRNEAERGNFNIMANQEPNPPNELVCPITQEIMFDPVVASDGHTYERNAIQRWLTKNNTSPMTKQAINDKTLRTNWAIRSAIQRFLDRSLVKDMVGESVNMLMKRINDGKDEDKKINNKEAMILLYDNDFNVDKAFQAYMMTQGGRKGGTRRNLRKKPRNQRKNKTKKT